MNGEPTLQDIFGVGATQTATDIIIKKADLALTTAAVNRGEQVFAAIAKLAASTLTAANYTNNTNQSISIVTGFEQIIYRTINGNQTAYLQSPLNINFTKVHIIEGLTPDDY
jgi:hypothetical protein